MKLLQIHYYFPPVKTVAALRLGNVSRAARDIFERVFVISPVLEGRFSLDEQDLDEIEIRRMPIRDLRWLIGRLLQREMSTLSWSTKSSPITQWLIRLKNSFPFLTLLGDGGLDYRYKGYRASARLIADEGITHIFSSFGPWADHLIAYRLKKRFPHLVWVADFRDPHADPMRRNVFWPPLQRWWAKRILQRADILTTVSLGMQHYLQERYDKPVIIWYNWCCASLTRAIEFPDIHDEDFIISYTGSLYPGVQDATPFLQALVELRKECTPGNINIRLAYAGKDANLWRQWMQPCGIEDMLLDLGELPWREALALQHRAQINLLLSWSSPEEDSGILTAKLFEYLNAKKTIIGLWNGPVPKDIRRILPEADKHLLMDTRKDPVPASRIKATILRLADTPNTLKGTIDGNDLWRKALESTFLPVAEM